jgi:hypothetical protein
MGETLRQMWRLIVKETRERSRPDESGILIGPDRASKVDPSLAGTVLGPLRVRLARRREHIRRTTRTCADRDLGCHRPARCRSQRAVATTATLRDHGTADTSAPDETDAPDATGTGNECTTARRSPTACSPPPPANPAFFPYVIDDTPNRVRASRPPSWPRRRRGDGLQPRERHLGAHRLRRVHRSPGPRTSTSTSSSTPSPRSGPRSSASPIRTTRANQAVVALDRLGRRRCRHASTICGPQVRRPDRHDQPGFIKT